MDYKGGPGTGALGGPPTGHNYKRAVYRAPPKDFTIEVLQPTKFGNGFCYGLRVTSTQPATSSDGHSTRSGSSFAEYEIWRRWEDCLWFQELLETEYALMARQKRTRLAAGKGVKKNGVYVHSDHAASFESLPPGPDANMIAKDIHEVIPRLTKKGTLFRASQATVDQRGREFAAMITAFFRDDLPTLVDELRATRMFRDFFGYWRRDLDHDRKLGKPLPSARGSMDGATSARNSVASSAFSMYFPRSNASPQAPSPIPDLPSSPAVSPSQESSRPNSMVSSDTSHRRLSAGKTPAYYATSESSGSTASLSSSSLGPQSPVSQPQDMTFFVSERGSLALAISEDDAQAEYINSPLSAPARVQPGPWANRTTVEVPEDIHVSDKPRSEPSPSDFHHGLQALPEDCELVPAPAPSGLPHSEIEEVPRAPLRRPRNNSCPDRTNRNCMVLSSDVPQSAGGAHREFAAIEGMYLDTNLRQPSAHLNPYRGGFDLNEPRTPTTATDSSRPPSAVFSNFSADMSGRSSWRTSMASMTSVMSDSSFAPSFASSSCVDFARPRIASPASMYSVAESEADGRDTALGYYPRHQYNESVTTIGSMLSGLSIMSRSLTPPPSSQLRRSFSTGSRSGPGFYGSDDFWDDQQDDVIDAYFYDPGIRAPPRPETPSKTPPRKLPQEPFRQEVASPDRFPRPFRDRPPGQFHLPWSAQDSSRPTTPTSFRPPSPPPQTSFAGTSPPARGAAPVSSPTSPVATESVTLKAVLHDSIVLLRIARTSPLGDVRERLREKFAVQEGLALTPTFVLGWAPPVPTGGGGGGGLLALKGRPRSNSASSVGSMSPQALRYLYNEQDWRAALAACGGGKMTVRLFNAQPM
ncbi:hypothetical protein BD413DRAFT_611459 [Trametes elegans]|nr:hypothetical protein BD413DRAFT_611459 [Trametes elegans]